MRVIYLDHNSSTPPAAEVIEAMHRALLELPGNPSSLHAEGRVAREAVEEARSRVAALLGCSADEILFTSGGTESDNLAVLGCARARVRTGAARHLVTTTIEHPAVEKACGLLEDDGFEVVRAGVDGEGRITAGEVIDAIRPDTALVTVMHANNETGALMPVRAIGEACRELGVPFHSDAAQSVGKVPVRVDELRLDLLTLAGHKLYGPRGVGALYVRHGTPLEPYLVGAGHEGGLRPGTENTPAIVGLGVACGLAAAEIDRRVSHCRELRDRLEARLREGFPDLVRHGPAGERLPNTLFVSFPGVNANALLTELAGELGASPGAACHSGEPKASAVLTAMGVSHELATSAVRLSLGRQNDEAQIDRAAERLAEVAGHLREGME